MAKYRIWNNFAITNFVVNLDVFYRLACYVGVLLLWWHSNDDLLICVLVGVDRGLLELLLALTLQLRRLGLYAQVGCIRSVNNLALRLKLTHLLVHLVAYVRVWIESLWGRNASAFLNFVYASWSLSWLLLFAFLFSQYFRLSAVTGQTLWLQVRATACFLTPRLCSICSCGLFESSNVLCQIYSQLLEIIQYSP